MDKQYLAYNFIHMLCATPELKDQLSEMLTSVDLSAMMYVFDMNITNTQSRKCMQLWR